MAAIFQQPDEIILSPLLSQFPGREHQIRSLASLLFANAVPCRNLVIYGAESTGKSSLTTQLLSHLSKHVAAETQNAGVPDGRLLYAAVNAAQCITSRHLFERIVNSVGEAVASSGIELSLPTRRSETLAQLTVVLRQLLEQVQQSHPNWSLVLLLDAIDRQRDAPSNLMPALARLSEIIPCMTCIFIVTAPLANFLKTSTSPHLHFPPYTKSEFIRILALHPPPPIPSSSEDLSEGATQQETSELWTRFCAAVHDSLVKSAARTLPAFEHSCRMLWPHFTKPITAGTHTTKEFSKLLIAARPHFQDESLLNPSLVSHVQQAETQAVERDSTQTGAITPVPSQQVAGITALLPTLTRLLLLAAYLASHNAKRHDLTLFSTFNHNRKRRRGGSALSRANQRHKHRKISRKLLGAHAFVLERMLAIFEAVRMEWASSSSGVGVAGLDGDVGMALATLSSLRLLVRIGTGDVTDRAGKWRVNIGWEAVRGLSRSVSVDIEEWLVE